MLQTELNTMAKQISKKVAYQFGINGIIIPKETLEAYNLPAHKTVLFNLSDAEREAVIDAVYDGDDKDGCQRYCFYHLTVDGKVVNVYDGHTDSTGTNDNWYTSHEDSGKEFAKFYKLVQV